MAKRETHQNAGEKELSSSSAPQITNLDLSSFGLENCTLEIRYPFALALWDKSGQVWKSIQEKWPEITPFHVEPMKTGFQLGKSRLQIEFEQAKIMSVEPERSLDQFSRDAKEFVRLTTQHLQISLYKRVGFRLVYFKEFKDKAEASAAFFSLGLITVPKDKKFEIDEKPINPQYSLRWESDKKGVM